ncbi:ribonuclease H-like domain-containing protein [Tanacetum coccineum]
MYPSPILAYKTTVAQTFTTTKALQITASQLRYNRSSALAIYASQPTPLPSAFSTMPLQDLHGATWIQCTPSLLIHFKASHSIIPSHHRPLHLHNVLDYLTRHILLRCDSSSDLYPVTKPSTSFHCFSLDKCLHVASTPRTSSRYKARHVAIGSNQQHGVDFDKTFSPVVKPTTIYTVLSLAVSRQWPIHQLDVKNAFLNGDLSETVYMHQPPGFVDSHYPNHGSQVAYLLIYVDDIILTASSPVLLQQIVDSLHKDCYNARLVATGSSQQLGVDFDETFSPVVRPATIRTALSLDVSSLERYYMVHCNPSRTPVDTESKLGPESVHVQDPTLYRSLVEGLQYLTFTRPDLSYVVQQLYASATTSLVGYIDADWAGFPSTCRSTSSYCIFLGDNLLSWSAKRQHTISCSSVEAEYRGVANIVAETAWLRNLLRELHSPLSTAPHFAYCDLSLVPFVGFLSTLLSLWFCDEQTFSLAPHPPTLISRAKSPQVPLTP